MRSLAALVLAAAAAAAPAQTLEQRAAEVLRTLNVPAPVETLIQSGTDAIASPAGQAIIGTTALPMQPRQAAKQLLETPDTTVAPQQGTSPFTRGTAFVNDPRGTAMLGPPPGLSNGRNAVYMPGLVVHPANGASVSGASNLTTAPRSFAAGDSGSP